MLGAHFFDDDAPQGVCDEDHGASHTSGSSQLEEKIFAVREDAILVARAVEISGDMCVVAPCQDPGFGTLPRKQVLGPETRR